MIKTIGKYTVVKELGKGGMATVYLAIHNDLGREVALKIMHPHLACEDESRRRFELEARAVAKLEHTNIIQIYDFGSVDGQFYIAMELVSGKDAERLVKANGAMPAEIAAIIASGIAGGLSAAHKNGIIHRDVKPANFIIKEDGIVKLSDFGIVRVDGAASMTQAESIVGTPYFIAPELIDGKKASPASDVYALGVSLYFMLSGKYPFRSETLPLVLASIAKGEWIPLQEVAASVPKELSLIVEKAMNVSIAKRYADANNFMQDINAFLFKRQMAVDPATVVDYLTDPDAFSKSVKAKSVNIRFDRARSYAEKEMLFDAIQELESILSEDPDNTNVKEELEKLSDLRLTKTRSQLDGATVIMKRAGDDSRLGVPIFVVIGLLALMLAIIITVVGRPRLGTGDPSTKNSLDSISGIVETMKTVQPANVDTPPVVKHDTIASKPLSSRNEARLTTRTNVIKNIPEKVDSQIPQLPVVAPTVSGNPVSCDAALSVVSPYWGALFVDDTKVGMAPTKQPLKVKCGTIKIRLEAPSGKSAEQVVDVVSGDTIKTKFIETDFK